VIRKNLPLIVLLAAVIAASMPAPVAGAYASTNGILAFRTDRSGRGEIYTNEGREESQAGDVIFTPRGNWHGFDNTGEEDVLLLWGWSGAGSLEAAGYELPA